jgi:hypothetical protein
MLASRFGPKTQYRLPVDLGGLSHCDSLGAQAGTVPPLVWPLTEFVEERGDDFNILDAAFLHAYA